MWIVKCIECHSKYEFIVGPFSGDDEALAAARELQLELELERELDGGVVAEVQTMVAPSRAMAGATF